MNLKKAKILFNERGRVSVMIITVLITLTGCMTQTPVPVTYKYSTQQKMQAAHHWDILAQDVTAQTLQTLTNAGRHGEPVYVEFVNSPYGEGFRDFLMTGLVNGGLNILTDQREASLIVRYKAQLLYHIENRWTRLPPGFITASATVLAGGVMVLREAFEYGNSAAQAGAAIGVGIGAAAIADALSGRFTKGLPHSEVILTTSLIDGDIYLMRKTDIYYINDVDFQHYLARPSAIQIKVKDGF
ncbi:hypothetical protein QUF75_05375 [Desulfococcaceae bacterium HSG7]|nr:hypothetical protein [Desulfococcaceae bacterium HSG9]MDM8554142.1 hypothetical protein [Desulfococcaceae bacterium HSG7]